MSPAPAEIATRVRSAVGWFPDLARGVVEVTGSDRVRWLNGMISADVATLASGKGAYALLLSPKGRILADLHVLAWDDRFWLDTGADQVTSLIAALDRYVIADDVALRDRSAELRRAALEGPGVGGVLDALGVEAPAAPHAFREVEIAGAPVVIAAWSDSGEHGAQLFVPRDRAAEVAAAVVAAAGEALVSGDAASLEVLRIEAGTPRMGVDLDEDVFPAEAGLVERAISLTKGCFTGQEIVARLESRGQVNHRLVGLLFAGETPPASGSELALPEGKVVGEVTSVCVSSLGPIGLGYARRPHDAPGTSLAVGGQVVQVAALPFVRPRLS